MPHRKEFTQLLTFLSVERTRLVWLYAEALRLDREDWRHPCDRLRAVERVFVVARLTRGGPRHRGRIKRGGSA